MQADANGEIRMMMRMMPKDRAVRGRVAVLLRGSPEALEALVSECDDEVARDLALLLPSLGPDIADRLLTWLLCERADLREGARAVLRAAAAAPAHMGDAATGSRVASRSLYMIVDRALAVPPERRAGLLLDMIEGAGSNDRSATLLSCAVRACGEAGLEVVLGRLRSGSSAAGILGMRDVLYTACRFGTCLGPTLLSSLRGDGPFAVSAAVGIAEGLGRSLRLWSDLGMPDDRGARSDARARRKWPPPVAADRDPKMMEALVAALEPWSETGDSDTRLRAIRAIGLMPVQTGLATIQRHVRDPLAHVRVAAIRALAVRADTAAARTLAEVAAQDSASEKLAAVQALGAAGDTECLPILDTLACEAEQAIASAARVSAQAVEHRAAPPVPTAPDKRFRMAEHVRGGRTPGRFVSLEAGLTALPADRAYNEPELTRFIAGECWDYSSVRRYLVEEGLLSRSQGAYSLTEFGRTAWRVERALAALPEHEVSEAPET